MGTAGWYNTGAAGTSAQGVPDADAYSDTAGTHGDSAFISPVWDNIANGHRVTVSPLDVLIDTQADLYNGTDPNPLSGVPGGLMGHTGAGMGRVSTPHHVNAAGS
jgi:hypothetical protein